MYQLRAGLFIILLIALSAFETDKTIIRPAVGDIAPEISLLNPDGDTISLSSLRGKVVLIDFWASWCRTCRIENLTLRNAYRDFRDKNFDIGKGFEIYSVSLDNDSEIWQKAIRNDRLYWASHVSDQQKWDSPIVKLYNFRYLPHNLLIDQNGKIVAKGLIGNKLPEKLTAHLAE